MVRNPFDAHISYWFIGGRETLNSLLLLIYGRNNKGDRSIIKLCWNAREECYEEIINVNKKTNEVAWGDQTT